MSVRITRISETQKGRFALFCEDDTFLFSVDGETLKHYQISEGAQLSEAALASVRCASDTRRAKDKALRYLSLRDHASGELYQKLCAAFDEPTAAAAVAEMRRLELLNDAAFASHRARYLAAQHKSTREILRHLRDKGIDAETAQAALEELEPSDADAAYALVQKSYLGRLRAGEREKVLAALARRGFGYGAAKEAVERSLNGLNGAEDGAEENASDWDASGWDEP